MFSRGWKCSMVTWSHLCQEFEYENQIVEILEREPHPQPSRQHKNWNYNRISLNKCSMEYSGQISATSTGVTPDMVNPPKKSTWFYRFWGIKSKNLPRIFPKRGTNSNHFFWWAFRQPQFLVPSQAQSFAGWVWEIHYGTEGRWSLWTLLMLSHSLGILAKPNVRWLGCTITETKRKAFRFHCHSQKVIGSLQIWKWTTHYNEGDSSYEI